MSKKKLVLVYLLKISNWPSKDTSVLYLKKAKLIHNKKWFLTNEKNQDYFIHLLFNSLSIVYTFKNCAIGCKIYENKKRYKEPILRNYKVIKRVWFIVEFFWRDLHFTV